MAGLHAGQELLRTSAAPTAFLCASDALALGVCAAVRQQGLIVGQDVSVVGLGNTESGQLAHPALCSIQHDILLPGQHIAKHLLALLGGTPPAQLQTLLTAQLIERKSLAQAPAT
ncbi:MAG: substrate-binding domain-containing protein [Brachymonas sp.]